MHSTRVLCGAGSVAALILVLLPTGPAHTQSPSPDVVINEVLVDPASGSEGDANGDGIRDTFQDEFIELVNRGPVPADIGGWLVGPPGGLVTLPSGTLLAPGEYLALFGGGSPTGLPGRTLVSDGRIGSGLSNTAGRLLLIDPAVPDTLQDITYEGWDRDASFVRVPEGDGVFTEHTLVSGTPFSPAGPSLPAGGPDRSQPTIYRARVANLTSSGFAVAWRTATPADGRLEVSVSGGPAVHLYDTAPVGLLHMAGHYGLAAGTTVDWRVVSGGTPDPADSSRNQVTGSVAPTVPYAVYGGVVEGASGLPVEGGHVFLRGVRTGGTSGWLAAVSDSTGTWVLNLGNLRFEDGSAFIWGTDDSLEVEADGGMSGVSAGRFAITGSSPQELALSDLRSDPAPLFEWLTTGVEVSADTTLDLEYSLTDPGGAWASLRLVSLDSGSEITIPATPSLLPTASPGTVRLDVSGLAEASRWQVSAIVEDGLNPPARYDLATTVRIAHAAARWLEVPAGIRLLSPTLDDDGLAAASGWLSRLPGAGEMARWDTVSASWVSLSRLDDGTLVGADFQTRAGEGYALVSAAAGSLFATGPRRYAPASLTARPGLALVGVADSSAVRTASDVLGTPTVVSVSRWDLWSQQWEGRFRLPDATLVGPEFPILWGDAVAVEVDSNTVWQPSPPGRTVRRIVQPTSGKVRGPAPARPGLLVLSDAPGTLRLLWQAEPGARLVLRDASGFERWSAPTGPASGSGWQQTTVGGLDPGLWRAELSWLTAEGTARLGRETTVVAAGPPALPRWMYGISPAGEGPLLVRAAGRLILVRRDPSGYWTAPRSQPLPDALIALAPDGGWDRWRLDPDTSTDAQGRPVGLTVTRGPLSVTGLEVDRAGPLSTTLRFQVLESSEDLVHQAMLCYPGSGTAAGPDDVPGEWVPAGEAVIWSRGEPGAIRMEVPTGPGPSGQESPLSVAVRILTGDGEELWLGPAPLAVEVSESALALLPAVPNPFNPETSIRFRIPDGAPRLVRLLVHDVRGRRVRLLAEGMRSPGMHAVRWDGRDHTGRRVAAGIYLVLLEVDGQRLTRKVLLLK